MKRLLVLGALGVLGCAVSSLGLGDDPPPPPPHQAIYAGCGTVFGTCARVAILADSQASGWDITVEVSNLGRGAVPASSLVREISLDGVGGVVGSLIATSGGRDLSNDFVLALGLGTTIDGYVEPGDTMLADGNTVVPWSRTTGAYDARCAATPTCDALRLLDHPSSGNTREDWVPGETFIYVPGPIVYRVHAASYTPGLGVTVSQWLIDGVDGEAYPLAPAN